MGWSFTHREKGESNLDYFRRQWSDPNYELLDGATVAGTFYGTLRTPDGVEGVVILTRWTRGYWNFGEKSMTEGWGPVEAQAPARILDLLSPIEDLHGTGTKAAEWATEWRARCRANLAKRAAVKRGSRIRLRTSEGASEFEAVDLRRNLFRRVFMGDVMTGRLVHIPWWRQSFELA